MTGLRRARDILRRLARSVLPLAVLGMAAARSDARGSDGRDAGAPANFDRRDKHRYSYEYYRERGDFGRPGDRLDPNDPRGHMSHGHGVGHL